MPTCTIRPAVNRFSGFALLLAVFVGGACIAGTPPPPPPAPAHARGSGVDQSRRTVDRQGDPYVLASGQGDTIIVRGDSLLWELPSEVLTFANRIEKVVPNVTHATLLYFSIRTNAHVGALVRPVRDLAADTTLSMQSILAEYADHRPDGWMGAYPRSWYPNATCGLPDSTLYHIAWVAYGALDSTDSPEAVHATGRVIGEMIVDPVRNQFLWTRGRAHGR